jgi:predicted MFS family arabinose efflux permease
MSDNWRYVNYAARFSGNAFGDLDVQARRIPLVVLVGGLGVFGAVFALNSSVHSYLILSYSEGDKVAMNVGFYYMANAAGRLAGTLLSGLLFQKYGVAACLWASFAFLAATAALSLALPRQHRVTPLLEMGADAGD